MGLQRLEELNDAVRSVFCFGSESPMRLVDAKLTVGERLGGIPADAPMLPLQRDVVRLQQTLRLQPKASEQVLELDLRKELHLGRSHLLHRLRLLGVPWGEVHPAYSKKGTFHEHWQLQGHPEFAVRLVEMAVWGNSVHLTTSRFVEHQAETAPDLNGLTTLLGGALLADLPDAVAVLARALENRAAVTGDTGHLMTALPPLVQVLRYGNVRRTDAAQVARALDGLVPRVCIGLLGACRALDEDAAQTMFQNVMRTHDALQVLADEAHTRAWLLALQELLGRDDVHGLLAGRATRLLLDETVFSAGEVAQQLALALSGATEPAAAAAWLEGFLRDSGVVLLHDTGLWQVLDAWLLSRDEATFVLLTPLLRRTFATFAVPERRQMGERVKRGAPASGAAPDWDEERAQLVMLVVRQLLGQEVAQ
ncbi:hypothetical protein BH24DEI2_BH24DEI2_22370 [soil metagenome]